MRAFSRRKSTRARLAVALVCALAMHAGAVYTLASLGVLDSLLGDGFSSARLAGLAGDSGTPLEVRTLDDTSDPKDLSKLLAELDRKDPPTPEETRRDEEKKREDETHPDGQIVDIERPALEERPEQSMYLAEYDSRVSHETKGPVGRDQAGHREEIKGGADAKLSSPSRVPEGSPDARPGLPGPRRASRNEASGLRGENGVAEDVGSDGEDARPGAPGRQGETVYPRLGEGGVPLRPGQAKPNLAPTQDMIARALTKGNGAPDYLGDLDDGESTALNAKKSVYASFFNRVKRDVAHEWNPSVVYVKHDPTGNIYGIKDRITVVRVHLRPDGVLANITLMQSSGAGFLDDEAMDAFRRAAPFVNPPPRLIDKTDGYIHFNFGFIFELSGHTSTRVLKYQ